MTTQVTFKTASDYGGSSVESVARASETLTESGTSAPTTITAKQNEVAVVTATADILVAFGPNPTAVADGATVELVTTGNRIQIGPLNDGDKVAIITTS